MHNQDSQPPVLPSNEPGTHFPFSGGIFRALGIMLATALILFSAPLIPMLSLKALIKVSVWTCPWLLPLLKANVGIVNAGAETVGYVFGFCCAIFFLKRAIAPNTPLKELILARWQDVQGKIASSIGMAVVAWIVCFIAIVTAYSVLPLPKADSPAGDFAEHLRGFAFLIFAFNAIVLAPLFEETLFRGFIFNMLKACFTSKLAGSLGAAACNFGAIIVSAGFFAIMHGTLTGFPPLFLVGCALAWVYGRNGNIYASMTLHAINNTIATIGLLMSMH